MLTQICGQLRKVIELVSAAHLRIAGIAVDERFLHDRPFDDAHFNEDLTEPGAAIQLRRHEAGQLDCLNDPEFHRELTERHPRKGDEARLTAGIDLMSEHGEYLVLSHHTRFDGDLTNHPLGLALSIQGFEKLIVIDDRMLDEEGPKHVAVVVT